MQPSVAGMLPGLNYHFSFRLAEYPELQRGKNRGELLVLVQRRSTRHVVVLGGCQGPVQLPMPSCTSLLPCTGPGWRCHASPGHCGMLWGSIAPLDSCLRLYGHETLGLTYRLMTSFKYNIDLPAPRLWLADSPILQSLPSCLPFHRISQIWDP